MVSRAEKNIKQAKKLESTAAKTGKKAKQQDTFFSFLKPKATACKVSIDGH